MSEIYELLRNNKTKKYCFLDFETANLALHECHNLPWQASMIISRGGEIEKEFDFYIKWPQGLKMSAESARITHFNPKKIEELGQAPEFVLSELDRELNSADIIAGHNLLGFDIYMVQLMYRILGQKPINPTNKILDTFPIAKAIKLEIPYNKEESFAAWQYRLYHHRARGLKCSLIALGKEYDINHDYSTLHDSLSDLHLNLKIWNKLKHQIDI